MQSGSLLLIFEVRQCFVQYEMLEMISRNKIKHESFLLTNSEYKKGSVNNHEIYIDGKLYDIVSKVKTKNNIHLIAIHDKEEENTISNIKLAIHNNTNQNTELPKSITGLNTLIFINQGYLQAYFFLPFKTLTYANFCASTSSPVIENTSPPPRIS